MKLGFHEEMVDSQRYGCVCCGSGCRLFLVPVRPNERQAIEGLARWREDLGVDELFVRSRVAGPSGYGLAKREDGACVFLDNDNLCAIHKRFGLEAKPLACQLFPFVLTPFGDELRVGLRFECQAVVENEGRVLTDHRGELNQLVNALMPSGEVSSPLPEVYPGCKVGAERLEQLNETLVKIAASNAVPLLRRLHWLRLAVRMISKIRWQQMEQEPEEDVEEFLSLLRGGAFQEVQRMDGTAEEAPGKKVRKLFGQYLFLMCQPTSYVGVGRKGFWATLRERREKVGQMKAMSVVMGKVPRVRMEWPEVDMAVMEQSLGGWSDDVEEAVGRYVLCRIAGMNTMGPNFYGYSLCEGIWTLLIGVAVLGWQMRLYAAGDGRDHVVLDDAWRAIRAMDGNLGYSQALRFGPAKLRLQYMQGHLKELLDRYVG